MYFILLLVYLFFLSLLKKTMKKLNKAKPNTSKNTTDIKRTKRKQSILKRILKYAILLIVIVVPVELASYLYIKFFRNDIIPIVTFLKEGTPINKFQNCISQSYLNYIPSPGYKSDAFIQHNKHGYRGQLVPLEKVENTIRILFLGGSTTYGWGVKNPDATYPAFTAKYLEKKIPNKKFEIINAGIPWGTSAEMLTHYLFKFRYYKPDIIVLNEGGNDAQGLVNFPFYQPDYNNWRKHIADIPNVGSFTKLMLNSNFFSVIAYHLFYAKFAQKDAFVHSGQNMVCKWYDKDNNYVLNNLNENAFYRNVKSLVNEALNDSARVVLLSFQGNPKYNDIVKESKLYDFYENILMQIANEKNVFFLPYPKELMPLSTWVDDCHLNEEGEKIKGDYTGEFINSIVLK